MCAEPVGRSMATAETIRDKKENMLLIQVKIIKGVFTAPQKREIVERLTEAMVEIQGENLRRLTWCVLEEVASCEWGIGGQVVAVDDIRALARSNGGDHDADNTHGPSGGDGNV